MIAMVNYGYPRTQVEEHFTEEEMKIYDNMVAQLAEERKKNPEAAFYPVETDW